MAEKKRGFHALEKRIHEMEEEDRSQEQRRGAEPENEQAKREAPTGAGGRERGEK